MRISAMLLVLAMAAGCGDMGGPRRKASGSAVGTGLVGTDNAAPAAPSQPQSQTPGTSAQPPAGQMPAMPAGGQAPGQAAGGPSARQAAGLPGLPGVQIPGQAQASAPGTVMVPAQAGVTGKGNYGPGLVTTPVSVYFQVQERLIFDQVNYALKLYEAEHGSKPKTEEEFMAKIVKANNLRLPTLPEGSKYKYDPQTGELLVEHPQ